MEVQNGIQIDDFSVQVWIYKDGIQTLTSAKRYPTLKAAKEAAEQWKLNVVKKYGTKRKKYRWGNLKPFGSFEFCDCQGGDMYAKYDIYGNKSIIEAAIFLPDPLMQFNYTMTHRREVVFSVQRKYKGNFEKCAIPPLRQQTEITTEDIKKHILLHLKCNI